MTTRISLRFAVSAAFAGLLMLALLFSSWIQFRNEEKVLLDLSNKIMTAQANDIHFRLSQFLSTPALVNKVIVSHFETQGLNPSNNLAAVEPALINTYSKTFAAQPALSFIGFGNQTGGFIGLYRNGSVTQLLVKDERTQNELNIFSGLSISKPVKINPQFDPRQRPWFRPAVETGQATWSDLYANATNSRMINLSYSEPIYTQNNDLIGVVVSDIRIDLFNQFLKEQATVGRGAIFIIDQAQRLVASSYDEDIFSAATALSPSGQRKLASESAHALIQAASAQLDREKDKKVRFSFDGEVMFLKSVPLNHHRDLQWRIVIVTPEKDLVGNLRQEQKMTMGLILLIGTLIALLGWLILSRITRPIILAAKAAEKLGHADWQPLPTPKGQLRETALLTTTFNDMAAKLALSFEQMNRQIRFDSMTGLMNRNGLTVAVNDWAFSPAQNQLMLLIGLDGYRAINDSVGHALGDALLQSIAVRLQHHIPANALLARTAGAEFTILIPEIKDQDEAVFTTLRYLAYFSEAFQAAESADEVVVTASIGVVYGRFKRLELTDWLRNASIALGKAKAKGFGSYALFEASMIAQSVAKTRVTNELKLALERQEFRVYFQPVIDLQNGETIGAEALIRWESPRGMISPGVFIPAAEDSGLILQIGNWVLRESCQQIANKLKAGWRADFDIHVNVSVRQLIQSEFYEQLVAILHETGLPAHNLTLEITESCLVTQSEVVASLIKRVRRLGVSIAIDDFGTGYSSLAYLHQFDFDYLKIDQSFIARMLENVQDEAIVSAIISMASGFKVVLVGEGIETEAQANRLRELGCQRVQGYFFGRPAPLESWPE